MDTARMDTARTVRREALRLGLWAVGLIFAVLLSVGHVLAQQDETDQAAERSPQAEQPEDQADTAAESDPTAEAADPSDEAIEQLMGQRQAPPAVAPTRAPEAEAAPTAQVQIDRSVLGVAPGEDQPTLRREGEFIVNRHGHVRRSADGAHMLFVFKADDKDSPEPPMILQPCQLLETMENIVQQRGEQVTFILSGQVHTYRGANYLLPTMMKIDVDRRDLE